MRGKLAKKLRSIARRSATSENKVQYQERKTPKSLYNLDNLIKFINSITYIVSILLFIEK